MRHVTSSPTSTAPPSKVAICPLNDARIYIAAHAAVDGVGVGEKAAEGKGAGAGAGTAAGANLARPRQVNDIAIDDGVGFIDALVTRGGVFT